MAARSPRDGRRVCSRSSTLKQSCEWDAKKGARERQPEPTFSDNPCTAPVHIYYLIVYSICVIHAACVSTRLYPHTCREMMFCDRLYLKLF